MEAFVTLQGSGGWVARVQRLPSGELENMVLEVLWSLEDWATPRAVHDALVEQRELAYTTVMTILARLWRKGALDRQKAGKAYAYRPRFTKEERAAERMAELLAGAGDGSLALTRFVAGLSAEQLDELRRALRRRGSRR